MKNEYLVQDLLKTFGIPAHLKGFRALEKAIPMVADNPPPLNAMTKKVYPDVGAMIGATASQTERAMRHSVEVAFDRLDSDTLEKFWGNTLSPHKGKPTNREFLAVAAQCYNRMREEQG